METGMLITVYLSSALAAGLLSTIMASAKYRYPGYWMIFCFLIPPIIVLLLILPKGRYVYHPHRDPFGEIGDDDNWRD